jgi:hypothetical protein
MIRVYSEIDGLTDCYVEIAESGWSVRDLSQLYAGRDNWLALFRRQVTGCHLLDSAGGSIDSPAEAIERYDDLDLRLARLLNNCLAHAVDYLATLGETQKRVQSGGGAPAMTTTPAQKTTTTTTTGT